MSRIVKIPTIANPFTVRVNDSTYTYKAGVTATVPDEVANIIDNINSLFPQYAAAKMTVEVEVPSASDSGKFLQFHNGEFSLVSVSGGNLPVITQGDIGKVLGVTAGSGGLPEYSLFVSGGGGGTAADVSISDAGGYYTSDTVEGALAEIGGSLAGKQDAPAVITTGTNITLADNTEYRLTDVTSLTLTYPNGSFACWLKITTAVSGTITITLPASQYIGSVPTFGNGETWEISIRDGIVVAGKAASAS